MSTLNQHSPGICGHCSGDLSIHKSGINKCPRHGREETRPGHIQEWDETVFENYKWRLMADKAPEMLIVLQQCLKLIGDLNIGHHIKPNTAQAQDMIQRIKAMEPRIYNLTIPLQ